jgi:hypothetical protein
MEKVLSYSYFNGLLMLESQDRITEALEKTKTGPGMSPWHNFLLKEMSDESILEFMKEINLKNVDFCGSKYRESLLRSTLIQEWISSWSGSNKLKNVGDLLEIWRYRKGLSGVFITQKMEKDKKSKIITYYFYKLTSDGRNYHLRYIKAEEKKEMFKEEVSNVVFSGFVNLSYDSRKKELQESYNIPHTGPKTEMTNTVLEMMVFKFFSGVKKEPRYIYHLGSDFLVNYYNGSRTLKIKKEEL